MKNFILLLMTAIILLSCISCKADDKMHLEYKKTNIDSSSITAETTYEECVELFGEKDVRRFFDCAFFVDKNGKNTVVQFSLEDAKNQKVKRIEVFDKKKMSSEDISGVPLEIDIFEVVEKIGLPIGSNTSGLKTLDFESSDGKIIRVQFDMNMKVTHVKLTDTP